MSKHTLHGDRRLSRGVVRQQPTKKVTCRSCRWTGKLSQLVGHPTEKVVWQNKTDRISRVGCCPRCSTVYGSFSKTEYDRGFKIRGPEINPILLAAMQAAGRR